MPYSQTQFQLTHLLQRMFRRLKVARVGKATGGSINTIADTNLIEYLGDANENDAILNWTAIIIRDSAGAGAAPEGEMNRISAYDDGGTITVPDAWSGGSAVGAGDTYMYISRDFPLYDMIEVVNDALISLGNVPVPDVSLTTAQNQTEYTLPAALVGNQLLNVEVQNQLNDANDNQFIPLPNHKIVVPSTPGGTGTLVIPQLAQGYSIRLTYLGIHPRVSSYSDPISQFIHPEVATAVATAHAIQWFNTQRGGTDKYWLSREDRAWNQLDIMLQKFPIIYPERRIEGFPHWGTMDIDLVDPPPLASYF